MLAHFGGTTVPYTHIATYTEFRCQVVYISVVLSDVKCLRTDFL